MNTLLGKSSYPETCCASEASFQSTIQEQLNKRKLQLTAQLEEVDNAIKVLEANPGFVEAFNALRKLL